MVQQRILRVFFTCYFLLLTAVMSVSATDFSQMRIPKVVISHEYLYMSSGYSKDFPQSSVVSVRINGTRPPKHLPVFYTKDPTNPFPYAWDVTGNYYFVISALSRPDAYGEFSLIPMPIAEFDALPTAMPLIDRTAETKPISLGQLFYALGMGQPHHQAFFDFIALDEQTFELYLSLGKRLWVWKRDSASLNKFLSPKSIRMTADDAMREQPGWHRAIIFEPIDFEGPFRVFRVQNTRYLFVERTGVFYKLEENTFTLQKIGQITQDREQSVLVIDKDGDTFSFYHPSNKIFTTPDFIHTSADTSKNDRRTSQIQPAIESAIALHSMLQ